MSFLKLGGKDYLFELNGASLKRVKHAIGLWLGDVIVDFSAAPDKEKARTHALEGFASLVSDYQKLFAIGFAVLFPQLEKNGVTQDAFDELMAGDAILQIRDALVQGLIDFFPDLPRKTLLRNAAAMGKRVETAAAKAMETAAAACLEKLTNMETVIASDKGKAAIEKEAHDQWKSISTTLPESLASILTTAP